MKKYLYILLGILIAGTLTASAAQLKSTIITGDLTISGVATTTGKIASYSFIETPYFTATSTTATSTFAGNIWVKGNQQVDGSLFAPITFTAGDVSLTSLTLTNPLAVAYGGTGQTSFGQGWLHSDGTTLTSSTSPTVNYITATSTTASTFPNASTTQLTSGTNTFYVDSNGRISGKDTTQSLTGVISPVRHIALSTATTTAWTASTTGAYIPSIVAPFAGTIQNAVCSTDTSFLGIDIYIASTHLTYFVASTTVGTMTFSSNNTFTSGQLINMAVGTTTTSGATKATCTLRTTETI